MAGHFQLRPMVEKREKNFHTRHKSSSLCLLDLFIQYVSSTYTLTCLKKKQGLKRVKLNFQEEYSMNESTVEHLGKIWEGFRVLLYYFIR